ncbi:MAG: hypothetical protein WCK49_04085, partial [Myxococcaceae bacterium]
VNREPRNDSLQQAKEFYNSAQKTQAGLINRLVKRYVNMRGEQLDEIFSGAHVVVEGDKAKLYEAIKNDPRTKAYERISSHESRDPQYGLILEEGAGTLLTGTTASGDTWFQFEGAPWGSEASLKNNLSHAKDYVVYKATGKNQGPFGSSHYRDANPLKLKPK